jgi:hypothetical protein
LGGNSGEIYSKSIYHLIDIKRFIGLPPDNWPIRHHFGGIANLIQSKNTIGKVNNTTMKCFRWHYQPFSNTIRGVISGYTALKK